MKKLKSYHKKNKQRYLAELFELLKIPSISADSNHKGDMIKTAKFLKKHLRTIGFKKAKVMPTKGHPVVYAEKIIDKNKPTVLIYGHYDVQPAEPLNLWDSPPFKPTIKKTKLHPDGAIFARGACDDKGQFFMQIKAVQAMMENDCLPMNVKFMIEGEEEIGSPNLTAFCKKNKDMLAADFVMVSDTSIVANDTPSITVSLRGLAYLEVEVTGPNIDLHSGTFGGAVANPINVLAKMIASLHWNNNRIKVPGFYDDVLLYSDRQREEINKIPFSKKAYKKQLDIKDVYGEEGYTTIERGSIRPTIDINGIWGGYIGEGAKTVLPSKAYAKISMRLVPNQDPDKVTKQFTKYFQSIAPKGVKVKVTPHHGGKPYVTDTNSLIYKAAEKAMKKTFGKKPVPQGAGGSIPIVAMFEEVLGQKSLLMGFGLNTDAIHSPNEHYGLFNFYKGIETIPYFFEYYSKMSE